MKHIETILTAYLQFIQTNYLNLFIFILVGIVGMLIVHYALTYDTKLSKKYNVCNDGVLLVFGSWITIISYIIHEILKPIYIKLGVITVEHCPFGDKCLFKEYGCFHNKEDKK